MTTRRTFLTLSAAVPATVLAVPLGATAAPPSSLPAGGGRHRRLANLDHLRFLLEEVPLVATGTHTSYRIDREPTGVAPWTYADADGDTFRRVGGGTLDPATGYYTQGAYNADDIARAAVVFLRDWRASGSRHSREHAYQTLRTLAYLQNDSGPNAGRVVLWQQVDGTLNPSAEPVELPDPSDSAESYWLARSVWAFGEGYAAFRRSDRRFAEFLLARLHLCVQALEAESLSRYGQWVRSDGVKLPSWLIANGADATAEAMLGLTAAVEVASDRRLKSALDRYGEGVAAMGTARSGGWPFGAVLPWTGSLGFWHAWGGAAPEALARAGAARRQEMWVRAALADAGTFTPQVLTSGGPFNAWAPVPAESQIAYGAHGRVAGPLAAAEAGGGSGLRLLAGLAAGWFFGANPSGEPVYDTETGVTFDGVEPDGSVNRNSGAESAIHGLLTMLLLDEHRDVAALATSITGYAGHRGLQVLDAAAGTLSPGCTVVTPEGGAWTGEGNLVGGHYVLVPAGEWVELEVEADAGSWALPLAWRTAEDTGDAEWTVVGGSRLGTTSNGGTGDPGLTEAAGSLVPQQLKRPLPGGLVRVRCTSRGELRLNALLVRPAVATARWTTDHGDAVLYAGATPSSIDVPALARGKGRSYDADGAPRGGRVVAGRKVRVLGGGFTITT